MNRLVYYCQLLGLQILLLPAVLLMLTALLFCLAVPITVGHFLLSLVIAVVISFLLVKKTKTFKPPEDFKGRYFWITTGVLLALVLISFFISLPVYDFSQDGMAYHQPGVIAMARGWNPFYIPFLKQFHPFYPQVMKGNELFVNHYTKGSWITAAAIYRLTGSLESGKLFNFLYLAAAFLVTLGFLAHFHRIPGPSKVIISALVALNPVALYQLFSYYNDGQLASIITVTIISAFHYIMFRERKIIFFLAIALLTLVNIKFTGLVYGGVVIGLAWLTVFIIDRELQGRFIVVMGATFLAAVFFIGFQPYMTNMIYQKNFFYPAVRAEKNPGTPVVAETVISKQAPEAFMKKNRFEKLFFSVFSESSHHLERMPQLKIPFSIHEFEMETYNHVDARYGGFGPLFGSVLLLIVGALAAILLIFKARKLVLLFTFIPASIIFISTLINPEAWWARLAPQLWLLPITFIITFYYIPREEVMTYIRGFALSILLLNSVLVMTKYTDHILELNTRFKDQMRGLSRQTLGAGKTVSVYPDMFYLSLRERLKHFKIPHRMVETLKGGKRREIIGIPYAKICIEERCSAGRVRRRDRLAPGPNP